MINSKFLIKSHLDNLKGTNFLLSKIHAQLQKKTKVHLFKEGQKNSKKSPNWDLTDQNSHSNLKLELLSMFVST